MLLSVLLLGLPIKINKNLETNPQVRMSTIQVQLDLTEYLRPNSYITCLFIHFPFYELFIRIYIFFLPSVNSSSLADIKEHELRMSLW